MLTNETGRARKHDPIRPSGSESLVGIVPLERAADNESNIARPPAHDTLDRARVALQVTTAGDRTPIEAWLSLTGEDRDALRETQAWHESELARLRREHPTVARAMAPLAERGMRWRRAIAALAPDEQDAALRIDEHERAIAQLDAAEQVTAPVIRHRRELLLAYRVTLVRRFRLHVGLAPRGPARIRPRGRARRLRRSPRRTRGPDDTDPDGSKAESVEIREGRGSCRTVAR
jgi:hypothetical protein